MRLDQDVVSLTRFRDRVSDYVSQTCVTGRPLLVTQRGEPAVIVMDVRDFEIMRWHMQMLEEACGQRMAARTAGAGGAAGAGGTPTG
jgi:prevent-host-death family protein